MSPDDAQTASGSKLHQLVHRVTYSELSDSIRNAINQGRCGIPVSVRLHWEFEESEAELEAVAQTAIRLADSALEFEEATWRERRHSSGLTLSLLGSDQRGRTALLTLVAKSEPKISMTVYGNHGVVRLEDACLDRTIVPDAD